MREATMAILRDRNLHSDVAEGKTKIFIRSPQTIINLEQVAFLILFIIIQFLLTNYEPYIITKNK